MEAAMLPHATKKPQRLRTGHAGIASLFTEHVAALIALASSRLRDPDAAGDAIQEVFFCALKAARRGQVITKEYLIRGVKQATARMNKHARRIVHDDEIIELVPAAVPRSYARDLRDDAYLDAALDRLSPALRAVFVRRARGLHHAQIAEELGISEHTSRVRLNRAIACLKRDVERERDREQASRHSLGVRSRVMKLQSARTERGKRSAYALPTPHCSPARPANRRSQAPGSETPPSSSSASHRGSAAPPPPVVEHLIELTCTSATTLAHPVSNETTSARMRSPTTVRKG
jgi:RNA polymerase sigma factor (sigma-70 family)